MYSPVSKRISMKTNCENLYSRFESFWGGKVQNQEILTVSYRYLYGEDPERNVIQASENAMDAIVYDGKFWRELNLAAMGMEK